MVVSPRLDGEVVDEDGGMGAMEGGFHLVPGAFVEAVVVENLGGGGVEGEDVGGNGFAEGAEFLQEEGERAGGNAPVPVVAADVVA